MPLGRCDLCWTSKVLVERDHIPPINLFEEPRPSNLITRPICLTCHKPTHKDDEAFRVFVTAHITRNAAATNLWKTKVVPRTLQEGRIKPFVAAVRKSFRPAVIRIGDVELPIGTLRVDAKPINRVIIRLTRGLYSFSAPTSILESFNSRFI